jgi:hypothetical protein
MMATCPHAQVRCRNCNGLNDVDPYTTHWICICGHCNSTVYTINLALGRARTRGEERVLKDILFKRRTRERG